MANLAAQIEMIKEIYQGPRDASKMLQTKQLHFIDFFKLSHTFLAAQIQSKHEVGQERSFLVRGRQI